VRVDEHTITIDDVPVFYLSGGSTPRTLYLHGVPTSSEVWVPFLERTGGIAPDLIGFGRSGKGGHLDYSPEGLARFVERFANELGIETMSLVGHGWGAAIGLLMAAGGRARVERMVLVDAVPLLDEFKWPRLVRLLQLPAIGELAMGSVTRALFARLLRREDAWTDERVDAAWDQFDQGTQRAILRLHRAVRGPRLAALGEPLARLDSPALIVWGARDPWLSPELAERYATRLPNATVEIVAGAGHWPWLDHPETIELVAGFLGK
jgi:pimeloyl-ACP methyl ester carboxylesterase